MLLALVAVTQSLVGLPNAKVATHQLAVRRAGLHAPNEPKFNRLPTMKSATPICQACIFLQVRQMHVVRYNLVRSIRTCECMWPSRAGGPAAYLIDGTIAPVSTASAWMAVRLSWPSFMTFCMADRSVITIMHLSSFAGVE